MSFDPSTVLLHMSVFLYIDLFMILQINYILLLGPNKTLEFIDRNHLAIMQNFPPKITHALHNYQYETCIGVYIYAN